MAKKLTILREFAPILQKIKLFIAFVLGSLKVPAAFHDTSYGVVDVYPMKRCYIF